MPAYTLTVEITLDARNASEAIDEVKDTLQDANWRKNVNIHIQKAENVTGEGETSTF